MIFQITYDYLVVALGLDIRFDKVRGLTETLGKNGVCSNYGPGNSYISFHFDRLLTMRRVSA